jgi:formate hydrogenlyase subunit 4
MPLAFVALLVVLTVKLRKSPFDFSTSHHGHQELVKGLTMEYSGLQLAAIEVGEWLETVTSARHSRPVLGPAALGRR